MKELRPSRYAIAAALLALTAGCGGWQPPTSGLAPMPISPLKHAVEQSFATPSYEVTKPLLYVTNYDAGLTPVYVYKANVNHAKPIGVISKGIANGAGACIDSDGTLYVVNDSNTTGWVSEYALGQTTILRVITKGINVPAFCAIDASGNLWVTNVGLDNVTEYLKGSTKPHTTIGRFQLV